MQEKQVTIGDTTFKLDRPFLVLATKTLSSKKEPTSFQKHKWIDLC
jgi:MoxR-like ATPase